MDKKEIDILSVKRSIGWAYPELKWLNPSACPRVNEERSALLASLSGKVRYSFLGSKIYTGSLSRGCRLCGQGHWSCLFLNRDCGRNCFYCPQDKESKDFFAPSEEIAFNSPREYADYLKAFRCKGAGLSGGEPFGDFEKLAGYIKTMRGCLGKHFYLWVYTNGDLVTKEKLRVLKRAGLNEVRFNISSRGYDLGPLRQASGIIDTVTVEIPMIPEDFECLKRLLGEMSKAGVKHLNLHQLHANKVNYRNFLRRDYTFLHQPGIPVLESEIAALRLIKYAVKNEVALPLHYCSAMYKDKFQNKGYRARKAGLLKLPFEDVTEAGYIRRLSVEGRERSINKIARALGKKGVFSRQIYNSKHQAEIFIRLSSLPLFDDAECCFTLTYFTPFVTVNPAGGQKSKKIKLGFDARAFVASRPAAYFGEISKPAILGFYRIYLEKQGERDTLELFYRNYNLRNKTQASIVKKGIEFLKSVRTWELLESGFPDIY
ncbi:MAG: radical SAM protein [Candidatus Omnitrophota bacterium]